MVIYNLGKSLLRQGQLQEALK